MNKHVKKRKAQFAAFSIMAVCGILLGSIELKRVGAHKLLSVRSAVAQTPPGLMLAQAAPDVFYDAASVPRLLEEAPEGELASTVPVLLYHGLVDKRDRFGMTPETFRDQMFALKRDGFTSLTMSQYLEFRNGGKVPARSFLLTFDDGRVDSFVQADPVLKATGFSAVMFVASDMSLHPDTTRHNSYYLTAGDLRAMIESKRWEVGSHARQHTGGQVAIDAAGNEGNFLSNRAWLADQSRLETVEEYGVRLKREILGSRGRIEAVLGTRPQSFSYPFGDFGQQQLNNPEAERMIAEAVGSTHDVAFRQVWDNDPVSKTNAPGDDKLLQKRIEVNTGWTGEQLVHALDRVLDKHLPYGDDFASDRGWRPTWGSLSFGDDGMTVAAKETSSGGDAILDGASWTDLALIARYDWIKGDRFTLIGRYRSGGSYVQCVFGGDRVRLDNVENGKVTTISEAPSPLFIVSSGGTAGIRLKGTHAECAVAGVVAVSGMVPEASGSVGFKVWDPKMNNAELRLRDVRVTVP